MINLTIPILVEGKYDKIKIKSIVNATVIATDGFGVFNNAEKRALIRRLGANGVVILSDSDGGGRVIRSHLRGMLGGIPVYDLYTPRSRERNAAKPLRPKPATSASRAFPPMSCAKSSKNSPPHIPNCAEMPRNPTPRKPASPACGCTNSALPDATTPPYCAAKSAAGSVCPPGCPRKLSPRRSILCRAVRRSSRFCTGFNPVLPSDTPSPPLHR